MLVTVVGAVLVGLALRLVAEFFLDVCCGDLTPTSL
jgi:hypothetical protein